MMRQVVVRGTAKAADVDGYDVGGKTGTADKPNAWGGYARDKTISTFASFFPADKPKYVLVDLPRRADGGHQQHRFRTAGLTAAPVLGHAIRRLAPVMGLRPDSARRRTARRRCFTRSPETNSRCRGSPGTRGLTMAGTERTDKLTGFETLGLLDGHAPRRRLVRAACRSSPASSVDSRDVRAGHLFAALPGIEDPRRRLHPLRAAHGRGRDPDRRRRASRAPRPRSGRSPCRSSSATTRGARSSVAAAAGTATSPRSMVAVTGTNGKTSVASFTRQIWEALGETRGQLRHRRRRGRGRGAASAHDARADHAAPAARRARRQGRDPRGDGGLEPRARPVPARRRAPGGGGLHQHHPRPPRLSPRLRGLLPGQARRSSSGCCRSTAPRSSTSTTRTGRGCGGSPRARGQRLLDRRPGRGLRAARSSASASTPPGRSCSSPGTARATRCGSSSSAASRRTNALVAAGLAIGSGSDAGRGHRRAAGAAHRARPHGAGGDAGERRAGLRRLRPHAGRADDRADRAPPARAWGGSSSSSAPAATATAASGR